MRIIAGSLRGRQFESPAGHRTHPMSEKARGAIFNVLGDIEGLTLLDAFAGSGAVAFEALSRGGKSAVCIDSDKNAHKALAANVKSLGLEKQCKVTRANVNSWLDNNPDVVFDIVVCDPPFDHIQVTTVQKLARHAGQSGVMVLSWPGDVTPPEIAGLEQLVVKNYGDNQLAFYRRTV